jgi:hypothetical protein
MTSKSKYFLKCQSGMRLELSVTFLPRRARQKSAGFTLLPLDDLCLVITVESV